MIAPDGKIAEANVAAEAFFEVSMLLLRRHQLRDLVPFGSPLLALIEQARNRGSVVNEYRVDLSTPRTHGERVVDLNVAPVQERPGHVVVMLQERTIADKMDRQLTIAVPRVPSSRSPPCWRTRSRIRSRDTRRRATARTVRPG